VIVRFTLLLSREDSWLWRPPVLRATLWYPVRQPELRQKIMAIALDGFITFNPRSVLAVAEVDGSLANGYHRRRPMRRRRFWKRGLERRGSKPGRSRTQGLNRSSKPFSSQFMA